MGSARIRGNKKPKLTLGTPGTDFAADLISYRIEWEDKDSDALTFEDAAAGKAKQPFLRGAAIQSTDSASFWQYCWTNAGLQVEIPYTLAPHGNAAPSAAQPHFVGMLIIETKPALGGEANADANSSFQFDYEFKLTAAPTLDSTP